MHDLPARRTWAQRALALAVSLPLATGGLLIAGQVAASAHTTAIQGHAVCDTATGTYAVTWVGATDQVPLGDLATVTTTSHSPSASSVPGTVTTNLAPNASYTFVQSGIPGTATVASVAVHVVWGPNPVNPNKLPTSNFAADATGSLTGLTGCAKTLTQTLSGHIYDCATNGTPTAVEHPGTLSATGPTAVATQASPLSKSVTDGSYVVTANAPAGYQFVACGSTPASGTTTMKNVSVPAGGTGTAIFYVAPVPVVVHSQTIAGNIYDCTNGATTNVVTGGTLAVVGTALTGGSTLAPTNVPTATYTMNATAPAGYQLVACGVTTGTPSSKSVVVPQDGAGVGTFYVAPLPVVVHSQTIAGNIYDCTNGATTNVVAGGTLAVVGTALTAGSTLVPTNVTAATYTMNATAPAGYQLVACGVTTGTPSSKSVVVPEDGAGVGTFYVAPVPVVVHSQTIAGNIYDCTNGATTNVVAGGTLAVVGTALTGGSTLAPSNVPAATYTMNATAPAGYQLVACGGNVGTPSTQTVVVPQDGAGVGTFYVAPVPVVTQTLEGHIYDCTDGVRGTTEHTGGSIGAAGPVTFTPADNPLSVTPVSAGDYDVVAAAPVGYHLVTCPEAGPATSHQNVTVPAGGAGNATFYVAPNAPVTTPGGTTTGGAQGPAVTPVVSPPAPVVTVRPATHVVTGSPAAAATGLPFTGSNSGAILRLGVLLLASGVSLLILGARRREV